MKKITLMITLFVFSLGYSQTLLQGFESGGINGGAFGGMATPTIVTGTGSNTSQVLRIVGNTGAAEPWQGINLFLNPSINLTVNKTMTIDVLSSTPITFLVKVTRAPGGVANTSAAPVTHNGDGTWQTLSFTFNTSLDGQTANPSGVYTGFVIHAYWEVGRTQFFTPTVTPRPARTFFVDNIRESAPVVNDVTGDVYINDGTFAAGDFTTAAGQDIATNDGSAAEPFATLDYALARSTQAPGDVIYIDAGAYSWTSTHALTDSGTLANPITIQGKGNNETNITTTAASTTSAGLHFTTGNHWVVKDLNWTATAARAVWVDGVAGITLDNCTFNMTSPSAIQSILINNAAGELTIKNSALTRSNTAFHMIEVIEGTTLIMQDNTVSFSALVLSGNASSVQLRTNASSLIIIERNKFVNGGYGIGNVVGTTGPINSSSIIKNNFFNSFWGIVSTRAQGLKVLNNSFYTVRESIYGSNPGNLTGWNIQNNILYTYGTGSNARSCLLSESATSHPAVVNNNLYYYPITGAFAVRQGSTNAGTLLTFTLWQTAAGGPWETNGQGSNAAFFNPLYVDAANGDLHLQPGSPAIGAGVDVGITDDIDGDARPLSGSFDIGADEFIATVTPGVINWTGATNSDWNTPTNWDTGVVPGPTDIVNIPNVANDPTAAGAISVASMSIESGASFIANATVSGPVTYERDLSTSNWYYISSPVVGQNINDFVAILALETQTPFQSFCTFDSSLVIPNWDCYAGTSTFGGDFINGKGYIVNLLGSSGTISYTGTMNVSDVTIPLDTTGSGYNLLGNPYTSFVNTASMLTTSTASLETQTLYVFDAATNSYVVYVTADDFRLAPGQAFFIRSNGVPGNVAINEAFQSHEDPDTFSRSANRTEVYLTLSDGVNIKNCRLYYIDGTTTGFDNGYDGPMFRAFADPFSIYTHLVTGGNGTDMGVQSLPNDDYENLIVPVGITAAAGTEFSISANAINLPDGINLYLEDRQANTFTVLNANSDFTLTPTNGLNGVGRFYLHTSSSTLGFNDNDLAIDLHIYTTSTTSELIIKGQLSAATNAKLYTIDGKLLLSKVLDQFSDSNVLDISSLSSGVYVVNVTNANQTKTQKVIIK